MTCKSKLLLLSFVASVADTFILTSYKHCRAFHTTRTKQAAAKKNMDKSVDKNMDESVDEVNKSVDKKVNKSVDKK
jgi:hypothetical protein